MKKTLCRLLAVLLGLVLAEGAVRAGAAVLADGYSAGASRQVREAIARAIVPSEERSGQGTEPLAGVLHARRFLHPYTGWTTGRVQGMFEAELERTPDDSYEIWVVGGSVASVFAAPKVPAVGFLERGLRAQPALAERGARILDFGVGAYKQPQQVTLIAHLLTLLDPPDLVLNLDGFNEVALAFQNVEAGTHPTYPSISSWTPLAKNSMNSPVALRALVAMRSAQERIARIDRLCKRWYLEQLAITGLFVSARLQSAEAEFHTAQAEYTRLVAENTDKFLRGPAAPPVEQEADRAVQIWEDSSRALHGLLAALGVDYLHVLQPTLHDPGAKPISEQEQRTGKAIKAWIRGVQEGYPRMRAAGKRLQRDGIAFFDASRVFAECEQTLYQDSCHFGAEGNLILARALLPELIRRL